MEKDKSLARMKDRIFMAVIADEQLINLYRYDPYDFASIEDGLSSENVVINAIAQIIEGASNGSSPKYIYNAVFEYLSERAI